MAPSTNDSGGRPLPHMEKLSNEVSVYRPLGYEPGSFDDMAHGKASPRLIILGTWTDAQDSHIAKYISKYQELYRTASILLMKSTTRLFNNTALIGPAVRPALGIIREFFPPSPPSSPPSLSLKTPSLLIHIFSNGGSASISNLYEQYAATSENAEDTLLPYHVTIFDSSPSVFRIQQTVAYLTTGMSSPAHRTVAIPALYTIATGLSAMINLGLWKDVLLHWGKSHNDPSKVRERRRVYIYSDTDPVVSHLDVEAHADQAEKNGFEVYKEPFAGSGHIAHVREDEARYWEIVRSIWRGTPRAKL
ncbi:unnamed protein product [Clonostachys chloroleuca]|uniref:Indole-diterpene biosynthesis protein PaxU n=1 Tax=Clonostachys chloroleuca TaxID=1926264 RepID=A0AA35LUP2_9HYPO|nr:unnamed protein product [Clonostachys chloroleuca]